MAIENEAAFPCKIPPDYVFSGLTKREWMAGMIAQGVAATIKKESDVRDFAETTLYLADKLLAALSRKDGGG